MKGHKCNNKKLYNCEVEKESDLSIRDSNDEASKEENLDVNVESEEIMPKISLAAITSIT